MSKREINLYIQDIKDSIKKIEKYTKGLTFDKFVRNSQAIDAVVRNLSIIGEAIKNIPKETRYKYPDVSWSEAVGMRNKIIHEYFGIDDGILWETIKKDLPALKKKIKDIKF